MQNESKSYPLPLETLPGLNFSYHLTDLIEIQSFIEGHGIQTKNTRIERYIEYLRHVIKKQPIDDLTIFKNSVDGPFQHSGDWMLYVLREIHELMWILKGLKVCQPLGVDDKLKKIVGGRDFAALDKDSQSRDAQFELRIASYFCQAGCDVDLSTDTDIIAMSSSEAFYLECKRVGSQSQLAKRLSEGRKQLRNRMPKKMGKRVVYGCVAADVTKVAFSHNGLTWALSNDHSKDIIQERLIGIASASDRMPLFKDCSNLASYWFQIHIPSLILNPPTTLTRFSSYHIFREDLSRKSRRAVRAFCNIFESASQGDERETPSSPLTPRTSLTIPEGSTFSLEEDLLMEFLERGDVTQKKDINEEIATLTIDGKTHKFSFFEFSLVLQGISEEEKKELAKDHNNAKLSLVVEMYRQKFPYEESENNL